MTERWCRNYLQVTARKAHGQYVKKKKGCAHRRRTHKHTHSAHTILRPYVTMLHSSAFFVFFVSFLFFLAFAGIKSLVFKQYCRSNKKKKLRNWIRSIFFFFNKLLNVLRRAWYSSIQYSSTRSNYYLNRQWNAHLFIPSSLTHRPRNQPANSRSEPPLSTGCIQPASPSGFQR